MGKEISERVRLMKQNFMIHHEKGKNIYEIAKIYGLSHSTVYNNLQSIADENNVTRASLLERLSSKHSKHRIYCVLTKKEILTPEELQIDLNKVISQLNETNNQIVTALKEE